MCGSTGRLVEGGRIQVDVLVERWEGVLWSGNGRQEKRGERGTLM